MTLNKLFEFNDELLLDPRADAADENMSIKDLAFGAAYRRFGPYHPSQILYLESYCWRDTMAVKRAPNQQFASLVSKRCERNF